MGQGMRRGSGDDSGYHAEGRAACDGHQDCQAFRQSDSMRLAV